MSGELKVLTEHVRELAVRQGDVIAEIAPAEAATQGVTVDVAVSHGVICAPTSLAVAAANTARDLACQAMQKTSEELQHALTTAAENYDSADIAASGALSQTMQGG